MASAVPQVPCTRARCGAPGGGCQIQGCPAQAVKRALVLQSLPLEVLECIEHGAASALFRIEEDLDSVPYGEIAVAILSGFFGALPRGWALHTPDGKVIPATQMRLGLEGWSLDKAQNLLSPHGAEEPPP